MCLLSGSEVRGGQHEDAGEPAGALQPGEGGGQAGGLLGPPRQPAGGGGEEE